jgi:hypothetical protein
MASSLIPFLTVEACLARFTATVSSLAAETPIVDARVAKSPGLAAMSWTSNNSGLNQLNAGSQTLMDYFVMKSRYQPEDSGWKYWEYFVNDPTKWVATAILPEENHLGMGTEAMSKFVRRFLPKMNMTKDADDSEMLLSP